MIRKLKLWNALENWGLQGIAKEWQNRVNGEFSLLQQWLIPTAHRAFCYPCDDPVNIRCFRATVGCGDTLRATCSHPYKYCHTVSLSTEELVIYGLNFPRIGMHIADAIGFPLQFSRLEMKDTYRLGAIGRANIPVIMCFENRPDKIRLIVNQLWLQLGKPFLFVMPTNKFIDHSLDVFLHEKGCFLAIDELLGVGDRQEVVRGGYHCSDSLAA